MKSPDLDTTRQSLPIKRKKRESSPRLLQQLTSSGKVRWMLAGHYVDGKRQREYFNDYDEARGRLQMLETARANLGTLADTVASKPKMVADAAGALDLLRPFGITLMEVAREWRTCREALRGTGLELLAVVKGAAALHESKRKAKTLAAIWSEFQTDPETAKLSDAYRHDLKRRWQTFEDHFGPDTQTCDISPDRIRSWLLALTVGDLSKGNYGRYSRNEKAMNPVPSQSP